MIHSVSHFSVQKFSDYNPGSSGKIDFAISIGWDADEGRPSMKEGWGGFIRLQFADLDEEKIGVSVGTIPDLHPRYEDRERLLFAGKYPLCDFNDAQKVVALLDRFDNLDEDVNVIVHCNAGVSRSGATANFIAQYYGAKLDRFEEMDVINKRWYRLLCKAINGHIPTNKFSAESEQSDRKKIVGMSF